MVRADKGKGMPDDSPTTLPSGASAEETLRVMLPLVVDVATKSAEGQTSVAAGLSSLDAQVGELKNAVQKNTAAVKQLTAAKKAEAMQKVETGKWLRALLKPETVYYTIVLALTAMGIRMTLPEQVLGQQPPVPYPVEQPGETP